MEHDRISQYWALLHVNGIFSSCSGAVEVDNAAHPTQHASFLTTVKCRPLAAFTMRS